MKFSGIIIESPGANILGDIHEDETYISLNKRLYKLDKDELHCLLEEKEYFGLFLSNEGAWIHVGSTDGVTYFHDIFNSGKFYEPVNEWLTANSFKLKDKVIGYSIRRKNRYVFLIDRINKHFIKKEGHFTCPVSDGINIYSRERSEGLYSFDSALNELWHQVLGGQSYSKADQGVKFHEQLLILNQSKSIMAFNKTTGERVWEYHQEKEPPMSFYLENGKVYINELADIIILDANTGEELVREPSGFPPRKDALNRLENEINVYPLGKGLLVFGGGEKEIKFFTADAKQCIQSLNLFELGYSSGAQLNAISNNQAVINTSSQKSHATGLLVLSPTEENQQPCIYVQDRLPTRIYACPALNVEHTQRIYIAGDRLDNVSRYAAIATNELQYETGVMPIFNIKRESLDRKHNGIIELYVDTSDLGDNAETELTEMIETVNNDFSLLSALSGNKKNPIHVKLIIQSKADWDESGDLIDLEALQNTEEKKPIS